MYYYYYYYYYHCLSLSSLLIPFIVRTDRIHGAIHFVSTYAHLVQFVLSTANIMS